MKNTSKKHLLFFVMFFFLLSGFLPAQVFRQSGKNKTERIMQQHARPQKTAVVPDENGWVCMGPSGMPNSLSSANTYGVGQIHRIAFDPFYDGNKNQTVYACSSFGGLWRSEDNGLHWEIVNTDHLKSTSVADVCINPFNGNEIFICSGYADGGMDSPWDPNWTHVVPLFVTGVYRSKDYGKNWEEISTGLVEDFAFPHGGYCRRMVINPFNPDQIFIATTKGIYSTRNATGNKVRWEKVFDGYDGNTADFRGLAFKPDDSNTIYASSRDIFRSTDGGRKWQCITGDAFGLKLDTLPDDFTISRINIAVTPANPDRLYAYMVGKKTFRGKKKEGGYIAIFEDEKWRIIDVRWSSGMAYFSDGWIAIAVSPVDANNMVYANSKVMGSENIDSVKFGPRSPYCGRGFHADVHDLVFQPGVENPVLFCGNDGGVSVKVKPDEKITGWEYRNEGLESATLWSFDDSELDEERAIIATQDNGTLVRIDTLGNMWHFIAGGDGYSTGIDDRNPDIAYYSGGDRSFTLFDFRTLKSNSQVTKLPKDPYNNKDLVITTKTFPMVNHPVTGNLFFGFTEVFEKIMEKPDRMTPVEDVWRLRSDIELIEPAAWKRQITDIAISKADPDVVYIVTGGQQNPPDADWQLKSRIFKSTTGLCSDKRKKRCFHGNFYPGENFDNDTLAIITGIAVDPRNADRVFISYTGLIGQFRVWYSDNGGKSWRNLDPNGILSDKPVNAIVFQENSSDRLYAGTDFGLYTKDRYSDWEKIEDFPSVRITELKINPTYHKLRVATFGRGLWEGPLVE